MARIRAYFKLDLYFFEHPKVVDLSHAATVLYIASIAYANRRETDGFIAEPVVRRLIELDPHDPDEPTHEGLAAELVRAGLWTMVRPQNVQADVPPRPPDRPGGYEIHDFLDHNESSAAREKHRADDAARKRAKRSGEQGTSGDHAGQSIPVDRPQNVQADVDERPNGQVAASENVRGIALAVTEQSDSRTENVVAFRADIDALCNLLADAIQANTGERPKVGKRWHDACRFLLDTDGYSAEQVEALIRWSQSDEFWRSNILSMPKLREKRLTLIGQMQRRNHSRPTSRILAEDAKLAHWANTMEGGEHAAERMAPHRGQARRELPRPGTPG